MKSMQLLIHIALPIEAKAMRKYLNLSQISPNLYANENILLAISGMGADNTRRALESLFDAYSFERALNFGMAGCKDEGFDIGALACTTHALDKIPKMSITSADEPMEDLSELSTELVDMESEVFWDICALHVRRENIYIFKVISDYGAGKIPTKSFVQDLLSPHIKRVISHVLG